MEGQTKRVWIQGKEIGCETVCWDKLIWASCHTVHVQTDNFI